jgi:hypothetical protein
MDLDAAAHGLDEIQESWSVLWGLPHVRQISPDAAVASSVVSRLQHLPAYTPSNLTLTPLRELAPGYGTVLI